MINPNQYQIDQQRRDVLMQQAEQTRLADAIDNETPFYAPLLANVGKTLLHIGTNLKERYGEMQPVTKYQTETA